MILIVPGTDGGARRALARSIRSMRQTSGSIMRSWMRTVVASFFVGAFFVAPASVLAADERFETQVETALAPLAGKAVAGVEFYISALTSALGSTRDWSFRPATSSPGF